METKRIKDCHGKDAKFSLHSWKLIHYHRQGILINGFICTTCNLIEDEVEFK